MLKRLTIRQRIILTFLIIALTGGTVQLIIAGRQLQLSTMEFYQHHLETDALTIANTLSEPIEHYMDGEGTSSIQQTLRSFQQDVKHDYLIVDRNYRIIAFTADTGYESMNRVEQTPELVLAAQGAIGADTRTGHDDREHVYVAVPIRYEGNILGYLVLSRPTAPAYIEVYQQWLELSMATLPVIILVIGAGVWLSGTISRPVEELRNSAMKLAEGKFDTRIKTDAQDEVGQLAHTFNYMAEEIEGLMQSQRSFVSNAAHELRTPLMTLKLRVEAIEDETLPPDERSQYMHEIQQEIDHMAELVSALLILARIDEGRHQQQDNISDTASTLHDIARHWRIEADKHDIDFETEVPTTIEDLPMTVNDLRLVLDNVLSNAVKYTQTGKVRFTVENATSNVIIKVCDTGIGFASEQGERLFTRFYRSEQARSQFDGHGLGLSIVQTVLERYNASITATSDGIGKGATFTITVPV